MVIANGKIMQSTNLSRGWARAVVDIPLPPGADLERAKDVVRDVGKAVNDDGEIAPLLLDDPRVVGVESFDGGTVSLRMVARTAPGKQFEVERTLRARIAVSRQREGIAGVEGDGR